VTTDPTRSSAEANLYTRSASRLALLFFGRLDELGHFEPAAVEDLPPRARALLAHREHMTVALESYHKSPVSVRAVEEWQDESSYARCSLLSRQSDGEIIQFGIMRIWLADLPAAARSEITAEKLPLGRVLINHNMLREVEVIALWHITPGPVLQQHLALTDQSPIFGRSAQILVDERPTVQVLEIVKLSTI
jgi:chorismate-pyruvate lyase